MIDFLAGLIIGSVGIILLMEKRLRKNEGEEDEL